MSTGRAHATPEPRVAQRATPRLLIDLTAGVCTHTAAQGASGSGRQAGAARGAGSSMSTGRAHATPEPRVAQRATPRLLIDLTAGVCTHTAAQGASGSGRQAGAARGAGSSMSTGRAHATPEPRVAQRATPRLLIDLTAGVCTHTAAQGASGSGRQAGAARGAGSSMSTGRAHATPEPRVAQRATPRLLIDLTAGVCTHTAAQGASGSGRQAGAARGAGSSMSTGRAHATPEPRVAQRATPRLLIDLTAGVCTHTAAQGASGSGRQAGAARGAGSSMSTGRAHATPEPRVAQRATPRLLIDLTAGVCTHTAAQGASGSGRQAGAARGAGSSMSTGRAHATPEPRVAQRATPRLLIDHA
ncbi:hypothetical protein O0L34_g15673 [Tuta absoluta]|nr:hypothetical protein O0L34_g15673 [Tuta absoluta]